MNIGIMLIDQIIWFSYAQEPTGFAPADNYYQYYFNKIAFFDMVFLSVVNL